MSDTAINQEREMSADRVILAILTTVAFFLSAHLVQAEEWSVKITSPAHGAKLSNPVKVCMDITGLILEPANNGVAEGKGHHHILFSSLPADLSKPIGRKKGIHMGDGLPCRIVRLVPGKHVIRALFAYGDHVPYNPPITDKILITIR